MLYVIGLWENLMTEQLKNSDIACQNVYNLLNKHNIFTPIVDHQMNFLLQQFDN